MKKNLNQNILKYFLAVMLGAYILWGITVIQPEEQGVVRLFGKVVKKDFLPGIYYIPPPPFSKLDRVKVQEIKRIYVGIKPEGSSDKIPFYSEELEYITGDINIVDVTMIVQYKIRDAAKYLFRCTDIDKMIHLITKETLTNGVGKMSVDDVLTSGKVYLQNIVIKELQKNLNSMDIGVNVVSVHMQEVSPPKPVAADFKDVWSSKQSGEKRINRAYGYRNQKEHEAKGYAQRSISEAKANSTQKVNKAEGEAQRFVSILKEYRKYPELTRKRLYLETMEKILPKIDKVIDNAN